jgi:hypothetical protein
MSQPGPIEAFLLLRSEILLRDRSVGAGLDEVPDTVSVKAYLDMDVRKGYMGLGTPLIRAGLGGFSTAAGGRGKGEKPWFVITIHHALYDDWGLQVVLQDLERAYLGATLPDRPFSQFVR